MAESALKKLLKPERLVRQNSFSKTYRAQFKLGEKKQDWDITHISIPFEADKEQELQEHYGVETSGLEAFYESFAACVAHALSEMKQLQQSENEAVLRNIVPHVYVDRKKKETRGTDIYIVTEPVEPLLGSSFIPGKEADLLSIVQVAARLVQIEKTMSAENRFFGAFDISSIYLKPGEDGKTMMAVDHLLYSIGNGKALPVIVPGNVSASVKNGAKPTVHTDLASICGMVWNAVTGKNYNDVPDLSREALVSGDGIPELLDAVKTCVACGEDYMNTEPAVATKTLNNALHKYLKAARRGASPNPTLVVPDREAPQKDAPVPAPPVEEKAPETPVKKDAAPELEKDQEQGKEEEQPVQQLPKKKKKRAKKKQAQQEAEKPPEQAEEEKEDQPEEKPADNSTNLVFFEESVEDAVILSDEIDEKDKDGKKKKERRKFKDIPKKSKILILAFAVLFVLAIAAIVYIVFFSGGRSPAEALASLSQMFKKGLKTSVGLQFSCFLC